MKFDKFPLDEELLKNLEDLGFSKTTDIQYKAIPAILNGEDVLAIAQTGSGKTAAFAIPIIQKIHEFKTSKRSTGVKCLILVPTRELAKQIGEVVAKLTRQTKATSYAIYGGVDQDPQIRQLAGGVDILIATPGRMFDLISQDHLDTRKVSMLVLDEADQMLDLGFKDDIDSIKRHLKQRHQTLFFSATISPKIKKLAYSQIHSQALRIQISPENMVSKNITHSLIRVLQDNKRPLLLKVLKQLPDSKQIIFVRTQVRAERFMELLKKANLPVTALHGGLSQEEREASLEKFKKMKTGSLIATDVSARGIDLPKITHVINVDMPLDPEIYVHRIGRTGRGFATGEAFSFCSPEEAPLLKNIETMLNQSLNEVQFDEAVPEAPLDLQAEESFADYIARQEEQYSGKTKGRKGAKSQKSQK